MNHPDTSVC